MRWLALALLLLIGPAQAAYSPDTIGTTDNNATLRNVPTAATPMIFRKGFATPGDGGGATYMASPSACSLNAGNGDGGSQVKSLDNRCWILAPGQRLLPEMWGAVPGSSDDAPGLNAAASYLASIGGGKLFGSAGRNYRIASTFQIPQDVWFVGAGWDNGTTITARNAMDPVVKLTRRSGLEDVRVDGTLAPLGRVVQVGDDANSYRVSLRRVYTNKGCIGLDITGPSHSVQESFFYDMAAGANCGGVRVGHGTTGGQTSDLRLLSVTSACTVGAAANYNFLFEDSGGNFLGPGSDGINCTYGTIMRPGANQAVALTYCNDAAIGDTNVLAGLLIDTASASGKVYGNMFVQCWTSTATDATGTGVLIQNTAGGLIDGNHFIGHRSYLNFARGVEIKTPAAGAILGTTFDGLRVCGVQTGGVDVVVGNSQSLILRNSRIGKDCDGMTAGVVNPIYGLGLGTNAEIMLLGNDFSGLTVPTSGMPTGNSVVADNKGSSNLSGPSYASAATVTLNQIASRIHLTGSTAVNTITPAWNGQPLCVISDSGALSFGTSGNITAAVTTSGVGGMICGHYDGFYSKWYFR